MQLNKDTCRSKMLRLSVKCNNTCSSILYSLESIYQKLWESIQQSTAVIKLRGNKCVHYNLSGVFIQIPSAFANVPQVVL